MARHIPRSGGTSRRKDSGESYDIAGIVVRDSFAIVGTLKAEAGFTTYVTRFKVAKFIMYFSKILVDVHYIYV